jgi:NADPH2:quinone reductase
VVTGASGSVGTALVQLLKAQGVCVVGIVSSAPKVDYVRNLGADGVVVAAGGDLKRSLADGIHTVTRGENADVVFDTVGGDLFDAALRVLKSEGRLIVLGFAGGRIPEVRVNYLLLKNIAVVGAPLDVNFAAHPAMIADGARYVGELYERGALRPHVKAIIGFPHIAEALDAAADSSVPGRVTVQLKS